ncbi:hypothetical protein O181_044831 [Austropuccinia psidii MF-1]|uniref:Uncharacterized protein n=1 Tax=Austropuccinia psidii MF-1 TaxID=1389203 RepID=A0A9Q3DR60_9BASI|nr:hypothetical protein [Austropuccinia psidii MF-1]
MSSKLTELTESSPSASPPSILCGSGVLSQLASTSMASSGHFDPFQTYDGFKEVEFLDPACTECLAKGKDCFEHYNPRSSKCHYCYIGRKPCRQTGGQVSNVRRYLQSKKDWPFGKEFPVSEAPTPDANSRYSAYSEGSDELDETPEPYLATIPTSIPSASPNPSHNRPALNQTVRPSLIPQPRNSPMVTSQQPQPVASTSRRREEISPLWFPAAQVFQFRDQWPIQVTREDPNTSSENKDSVARFFGRVDRNIREVIMYANDSIIPGTASEEMAAKFAFYEDELINDFQRTSDDLGRDN